MPQACEDMAMAQLLPDGKGKVGGEYRGPEVVHISLSLYLYIAGRPPAQDVPF